MRILPLLLMLCSCASNNNHRAVAEENHIPLVYSCKMYNSLNEEFKTCDYKVENDLEFNLMISKKSGRHTLTIFKQNPFNDESTKFFLKGGNYVHSCLIISSTNPADFRVSFISVKTGEIVSDWGDPLCALK